MTDQNAKKIFTVLCIDGGGVRGVIPARILAEIEKRTGKPIAELFDMVGGTSTGAIIGSCLLSPDKNDPKKPRYTAQQTLDMYHTLAEKVFPELRFKGIRKLASGGLYDPKPLEDLLQANLGDLRMKDSIKSFLIPAADIKRFKPVWITHLDGRKDESAEGWDSMLMRDAVRAATSAPTYFPARYYETTPNPDAPNVKHRHALTDGGLFASHAMEHLLDEARKMAPEGAEIVLVHVGTGAAETALSPEEFNSLGPIGLVSPAHGNVLMSLVLTMSKADCVNDMRGKLGDNFFSFEKGILPKGGDADTPSIEMDDSSADNLKKLEKHAEKTIAANSEAFDRMCDVLKNRAFSDAPRLESSEAVRALSEKMAAVNTLKALTKTYLKIVHYTLGIEEDRPSAEDLELKALAEKLTDQDKSQLDRIYRVLLDKKQHESRLLNGLKEAGQEITDLAKKIFVEPFKPDEPAANDDQPPADSEQFPKRGNDKPKGP